MHAFKMFIALFGAMSFGTFSAYDYVTMSIKEKLLLENVEALSSDESIVMVQEAYAVLLIIS